MRRLRVLLVMAVTLGLSGCAWMARASVSSDPAAVEGNGASTRPSLSQAGRYVAFQSVATNLVAGDTNGVSDVFVRDDIARTTERVSVASDGAQGNAASRAPALSDDGRFVAFETDASNLVTGDTDDDVDVVVHDRQLGTTTLVSTEVEVPPPVVPGEFDATAAAISGDGAVVAFNIAVPFDGSCCAPLGPYVRDLAAETTTVMPSAGGGLAFGLASLSDDGTRIAYGQFGPLDELGNAPYGVVVVDTTNATVVAPVAGGTLSHQGQSYFDVALSGDGGTVAFVFVNFHIGTLHRFELHQPGLVPVLEGLGSPGVVTVSDDGSLFGLVDNSGYLVTDAAGSSPRIVSADPFGRPAATVDQQSGDLSGDGRFVAFASADPDLLPRDTNGVSDVFVRVAAQSMTAPS